MRAGLSDSTQAGLDPTRGQRRGLSFRVVIALSVAAMAYGLVAAYQHRWVCDDAYISYRYALNLVEGRGLVYNEGERVEGYSNFLWTLWCALSLAIGVEPEGWTIAWGVLFYLLSIGLLAYQHLQLRRMAGIRGFTLPLAAVLAALHDDWSIYATSGLETSLFTFLLITAYVLLARSIEDGRQRPIAAGIVLALAALTRPEGAMFGVIGGAAVLWLHRPRWGPAMRFALAFGLPYAVFLAWRGWYYGELMPNTYYAKSAHLAWWSQGFKYLWLYMQKYRVLCLAALAVVGFSGARPCGGRLVAGVPRTALRRTALLAAAFALPFTIYITRLGGDFMFARMLIPSTPFFLILLDAGMLALFRREPPLAWAAALASIAVIVLPPFPMKGQTLRHGVANEWSYYTTNRMAEARERRSAVIRKYFDGLPVRIAYLGSEALVMYRARIPVAIEAEAGLTDRFIAHQELRERGRVGHEKHAPIEYLVADRKVHFTFSPAAPEVLKLPDYVPRCDVVLDGLRGWALHWDAEVMAELKRRGAQIADIPAQIDEYIRSFDQRTPDEIRSIYAKLKRFYFNFVDDPRREEPFCERLGLSRR